jgi:hypothetical protein
MRLTTHHQHEAGITTRDWKHIINMKLESHHKAGNTSLLPLSREVLSDYTKLISKVLKIYTR